MEYLRPGTKVFLGAGGHTGTIKKILTHPGSCEGKHVSATSYHAAYLVHDNRNGKLLVRTRSVLHKG